MNNIYKLHLDAPVTLCETHTEDLGLAVKIFVIHC